MHITTKAIIIGALISVSYSASAMNVYKDKKSTLDIYGRLEWQLAHGDASFAEDDSRSQLGGRLGLYLTHKLDLLDETKIVGRVEWQVRTEKNDNKTGDKDLDARYAYLGLSHKRYGELIGGRTKNPLYQVMKMTDRYKNFTPNVYSYGITTIDSSYQFNRQDGTVQWNGEFDGHQIQLAYVMGNGNSDNDALDDGIMASYRKTWSLADLQITPAIAASEYKRKEGIKTTDGRKKHTQYIGGLQLDYGNISLATTVGRVAIARDNNSDNDYTSFDSLASWKYQKVRFLGGYSTLNENGKKYAERRGWRAETQLSLAKDTWLSLSYVKELANKNKPAHDDAFIAGLRYDF
ncbi:putative porin [Raoultella sp. BIGb0149]|uniref:porin n=1 Tax=Raoultella sp. BIGb0149 TaxID=2485116 RepID=UPI00105DD753|nr:porin [Raoultella sp. BIGb0149]TDQ26898.1 putative porin [Raoultella sp. BIGb0149]